MMVSKIRTIVGDRRGVTYVETLVYVILISIVMFSMGYFVVGMLYDRTRGEATLATQENSRLVLQRVVHEIQSSKSINSSSTFSDNLALEANGGKVLSLEMASSTINPTEFSVLNNVLHIKQGSATATPITSNDVRVTDLSFENMSVGKARNVGVVFTIEYLNPGGVQAYSASTTLRAGATLRNR